MILHWLNILLSRWRIKYFLIPVLLYGLSNWIQSQTGGFQCHKILSDLTFRKEWELPSLQEHELAHIKAKLNQPYTFLASGGESFAFLSQDGKYVLKLFKHHHLRIHSFLCSIKFPWGLDPFRLKLLGGRAPPEERLQYLFNSAKIAYLTLREETALLYLHLNKSHTLNQTVTLIDKIGIAHTFPLDHLEFALQERSELLYPAFERLLLQQDSEGIKKRIISLLTLFKNLEQKGIKDQDAKISRNFGFINEQAVRIDIGGLIQKSEPPTISIKKLKRLHDWLLPRHPALAEFFETELEKIPSY